MKINFDNTGNNYLEIVKQDKDKVKVTLSSVSPGSVNGEVTSRQKLISSTEISIDQFKDIVTEILL